MIVVSILTFISRILGFIRDVTLAYFLGATVALDAFLVAFKLPNLFRRLYAEGVLMQAIVPAITQEEKKGKSLERLLAELVGTLGSGFIIITILLFMFSPEIVKILAPGFSADPLKFHLTTQLMRMTLPYLLWIALSSIYCAFLNAKQRFMLPASLPVVLNVIFLAVLISFGHSPSLVIVLAFSISVIGIVQLLFSAEGAYRQIPWQRPVLAFNALWIKEILVGFVPTVFAISVIYLGFLIDMLFASSLKAGSISSLYYSERLVVFPISLVGSALTTVLLPKWPLAQDIAAKENLLSQSLGYVFLGGIPATLGLYFLSGPIIATLFYHGVFGIEDVVVTARCLAAFSLGVLPFILIRVLCIPYFHAGRKGYPFICASIAIFVNILCDFVFIHALAEVGLALSTAIAGWVNALLLLKYFFEGKRVLTDVLKLTLLRYISLNVLFAVLLYFLQGHLANWLLWDVKTRVFELALRVGGCVFFYGILLKLLGMYPKYEAYRAH